MPVVWKDLNPVPGVRVSGAPGAFCLAFPGAVFGFAASEGAMAACLPPSGAVEALRILLGPARRKPKASTFVLASQQGEKPDSAAAKAARKAAQESGWLDAIGAARRGGLEGAGLSRRCFVEFIPTVVNCAAFQTAQGPAIIVVTDAPAGERICSEIAQEILCEHAPASGFAAVVAAGSGSASPARTEAVAAMIRAVADDGFKAVGGVRR